MVRVLSALVSVLISFHPTGVHAQDSQFDIESYISMSVSSSDDTICIGDTLWIKIELKNITKDTIKIYPRGIFFLEFDHPVYDNRDLIQISDRITKKEEALVYPNKYVYYECSVKIDDSFFRKGNNEFKVNHITYPFWLHKRERSKKIYGKLISDFCTVYVL